MVKQNKILLETGTNEMELLTVIIDDQYFGMNVAKVQAIQQYERKNVTVLPVSPEGVEGMLLYRDRTIPLIDLSIVLGVGKNDDDEKQIVVVTEFNNATNSFKIHGVDQIYRVSWDKLVPLSEMLTENSLFSGTVFVDGHEILVLDLEHILADLFPSLVLEEVTQQLLEKKLTFNRDKLNILFAEDSIIIRRGVIKTLNKAGFKNILEFENGQLALDYITKNEKKIRDEIKNTVMISDIEMPKLDGLSLCKKVKNDFKLTDLHIVMFSSLINDQMIVKCKDVGANDYITNTCS